MVDQRPVSVGGEPDADDLTDDENVVAGGVDVGGAALERGEGRVHEGHVRDRPAVVRDGVELAELATLRCTLPLGGVDDSNLNLGLPPVLRPTWARWSTRCGGERSDTGWSLWS